MLLVLGDLAHHPAIQLKYMAHNPDLVPKKHPYKLIFGQRPLTHFRDYRNAIKVELLEPESKDQMMKRLYQFVRATWADFPDDNAHPTEQQMRDGLDAMLSGKALGLGLEATSLTFKISGITRVDLQQIVRQRVDVTFSVQCTGDRDLRHNPILVEESIAQDPELLKSCIDATLKAKQTYVDLLDSQKVSIQAARLFLPEARDMHMYMRTSISTLLQFYLKRIDDSSQTWQINEVARKMAEEVCKVYPEMDEVFKRYATKFTMAKNAEADRTSTFATALYIPKVDSYDYHERDYLYNKTKEEFNFTNTPVPDRYFWGYTEVDKATYDKIYSQYMESAKQVDEDHASNAEIHVRNHQLNNEIQLTI